MSLSMIFILNERGIVTKDSFINRSEGKLKEMLKTSILIVH